MPCLVRLGKAPTVPKGQDFTATVPRQIQDAQKPIPSDADTCEDSHRLSETYQPINPFFLRQGLSNWNVETSGTHRSGEKGSRGNLEGSGETWRHFGQKCTHTEESIQLPPYSCIHTYAYIHRFKKTYIPIQYTNTIIYQYNRPIQ